MNQRYLGRLLFLATSLGLVAASESKDKVETIRYVAIGDSYSIGEGAKPDESWPAVLTKHLHEKGIKIELVANPSRTGWTTQNAIDRELPVLTDAKPTFVTLLIGVNDWVQGVDEKTFRERLTVLMARMLEMLPDKKRFLVVTIPDFGVTPTGSRYSRGRNISEGIASFNEVILQEARKRNLPVVDIFPISKQMQNDHSLVAEDGLHPSAKEYAEWEKIIRPVALKLLEE
ncbi:MAG TPA: SGNH/GDSL hydrolase family protein [Chthoniobacterales bacterium]|jgi:lysophospholipase L1-like esterase